MPTPLPVIPDTFRVAFNWKAGTQTAVNVMHFRAATSGVAPTDVATSISTVSAGAFIDSLDVTPLDGSSAAVLFPLGNVAPFVGHQPGDMVPNVAVIAKYTTGLRGRDNRGRSFLPFIGEGAITNGFLLGPSQAAMETAWRNFEAALTTAVPVPLHHVVASYDRAHAGAGAHANNVTTMFIELALGTQRRRQSRLR
jgi:hypothetical protein